MNRPLLTRVFISALLFILSFPPYGLWPLAFVCYVPWLLGVRRLEKGRSAFFSGVLLSLLISLGGYFFVATTLEHFGGLPWPVAILGCALFGLFNQLQLAFFGRVYWASAERPWWSLVAIYGALDWVIPKLFMDSLGLTWVNALPLAQWAEHIGMYGLTAIIVAGNLFAVRAVEARSPRPVVPYLGVLAVLGTLGWIRKASVERAAEVGPPLRVAVIQANIGDFEKIASERGYGDAPNVVVRRYIDLMESARKTYGELDAMLWPETAYPSTFLKPAHELERQRDALVTEAAVRVDTPVWLGGYDRDGRKDYNAVFFLDPQKGPSATTAYHKSVLLPFAEYIPGAESIGWIRRAFPQVGFFGRGNGPEPYRLRVGASSSQREITAIPLICYEALFGWFSRGGRLAGGQVLLNFTNDSWFGPWGEPQLHLGLSQLRSIESRMPQLRATNTGISAAIGQTGELLKVGPIGEPEAILLSVPMGPVDGGLYLAAGDWWGFAMVLVALGLVVAHVVQTRRRS